MNVKKLFLIFNPFEWGPLLALQKRKHVMLYERCMTNKSFAMGFLGRYVPHKILRKKGRALDVGCSKGRIAAMLAVLGFKTTGIDTHTDPYWSMIAQRTGAQFVEANAEHLPFADGSFDLCTAFLSLEYMQHDDKAIAEMHRALKRNGMLFIQVANKHNLKSCVRGTKLDALHVKEYDVKDISSLLSPAFRITAVWSEKLYVPYFTTFFNYVYELILTEGMRQWLSKRIPEKYRGCINVRAVKVAQ